MRCSQEGLAVRRVCQAHSYPAASQSRRLNHSPTDALIDLIVGGRLRRQIPIGLNVHPLTHHGLCRNRRRSSRARSHHTRPWQSRAQRCRIPDTCETPGGHGAVPAWAGCLMMLGFYSALCIWLPSAGRQITPELIAGCAYCTGAGGRKHQKAISFTPSGTAPAAFA